MTLELTQSIYPDFAVSQETLRHRDNTMGPVGSRLMTVQDNLT